MPSQPAPPNDGSLHDLPVLLRDLPLRSHQTFGFDVRARHGVHIDSEAALVALRTEIRRPASDDHTNAPDALADMRRLVIGGGSNLVMTGDFDGLVILMTIAGRRVIEVTDDRVLIEAGAGENWHTFVEWTLDQGFAGLENLALIPGTVGASPVQNIGAYGLELADRFHSLRAFDWETGLFRHFDARDCRFGYRDSVFKDDHKHEHEHEHKHAPRQSGAARFIITSVTFALPRPWRARAGYADLAKALQDNAITEPTARDIFDAVVAVRRAKLPDPAQIGNAGSFFKNPIVSGDQYAALRARREDLVAYPQADGRFKLAAGWLIDQCGWKGRALGHAAVHPKQALVLVNPGQASGVDVLALADAIRKDVMHQFGVALEIEPLVV